MLLRVDGGATNSSSGNSSHLVRGGRPRKAPFSAPSQPNAGQPCSTCQKQFAPNRAVWRLFPNQQGPVCRLLRNTKGNWLKDLFLLLVLVLLLLLTLRRLWYSMVNYLDDSIGAVVGALESRGMLENTLITFSSDNVRV